MTYVTAHRCADDLIYRPEPQPWTGSLVMSRHETNVLQCFRETWLLCCTKGFELATEGGTVSLYRGHRSFPLRHTGNKLYEWSLWYFSALPSSSTGKSQVRELGCMLTTVIRCRTLYTLYPVSRFFHIKLPTSNEGQTYLMRHTCI